MDNYIIKEGDTLGCTDGHKPIVVKEITATHVTFTSGGKEQTVKRGDFEYALWSGPFFLLEHAP